MSQYPIQIAVDPFKVAEWMGWGHGDFAQAIYTLPAGVAANATVAVPDDEIWWVTYSIIGEIPSSSVLVDVTLASETFGSGGEDLTPVVAHEGWIGTPFCPPGWHRCEGPTAIHCTWTNLTGDTTYNDLPSQDIFIHHTFLLFKIKKRYVEKMDKWMMDLIGGI